MKTNPVILGTLTAVSLLCASPAAAQIHVLNDDVLARIVPRLQEIDFEEFYPSEFPDNPFEEPGLPSP
jgi:hypothetical protein